MMVESVCEDLERQFVIVDHSKTCVENLMRLQWSFPEATTSWWQRHLHLAINDVLWLHKSSSWPLANKVVVLFSLQNNLRAKYDISITRNIITGDRNIIFGLVPLESTRNFTNTIKRLWSEFITRRAHCSPTNEFLRTLDILHKKVFLFTVQFRYSVKVVARDWVVKMWFSLLQLALAVILISREYLNKSIWLFWQSVRCYWTRTLYTDFIHR